MINIFFFNVSSCLYYDWWILLYLLVQHNLKPSITNLYVQTEGVWDIQHKPIMWVQMVHFLRTANSEKTLRICSREIRNLMN
jgi:hypothetical protein